MQEDREYILTHMSERELADYRAIGGRPIVASSKPERGKWYQRPERIVYAKTLRPVPQTRDAAA